MTSASRFLWLYDQITEQEMSPQQIAVLFVLLAREEAGLPPITKYELGALVGVTERYVATILSDLQKKLALILAGKGEKKGRGRAPNKYTIRPDSVGAVIPEDWIRNCKSGTVVPEQRRKPDADSASRVGSQSSNSGTEVPVICGEVLPPMEEHAGARAEDNLKLLSKLELNPERVERVCGAREMPAGGGNLDVDWVLSSKDRDFANERGFLNGSCDELFGQFLDRCTTHGPRTSLGWGAEWRKWVRNQVKFDTERAQRAKSSEANHDQSRNRDADPGVRRRQRSPLTERARVLMSERDDDGIGGMAPHAGK